MNVSIKISNQYLSTLLQRIGEALGDGKDLVLEESINETSRYVYTRISGGHKKLLEMEGESQLEVNKEGDMEFSEEEIKMMEETKICSITEDEVDLYYCSSICPIRSSCL